LPSKLLIVGALTGLVFWGVTVLFESDSVPFKKVRVDGLFEHVSQEHLQNIITNNISGGFFNVDVAKIESTVKEMPWIQSASVRRVWPDTLRITVKEQEAVAIWNNNGLLNAQGAIFYPELKSMPGDLPHLRGPEDSHSVMLSQYKEMTRKLSNIDQKISVLEMDDRQAWRIVLNNDVELVVGRINVYQALDRFVDVVSGVFSKNMKDIAQVDLRYTNGFAVKWKSTHLSMMESSTLQNPLLQNVMLQNGDSLRRNN